MPERATALSRSEKSAEVVVAGVAGPSGADVTRGRTGREGVRLDVSMQFVLPQMSTPVRRAGVACGEAAVDPASEETNGPRRGNEHTGSALLPAALTRENLQAALRRVRANKGAAGVDG